MHEGPELAQLRQRRQGRDLKTLRHGHQKLLREQGQALPSGQVLGVVGGDQRVELVVVKQVGQPRVDARDQAQALHTPRQTTHHLRADHGGK